MGDVGSFHVDATVRHGGAKIIVPVGAMETVAHSFGKLIVIKEENIGNIGEVVVGTIFFGTARHFLRTNPGPNVKSTGRGAVISAGRDKKIIFKLIIIVGIKPLVSEVDFDAFGRENSGFTQNLGLEVGGNKADAQEGSED